MLARFSSYVLPTLALFLLAGALWIAANPYIGIDHDARLYAFMAVHSLTPSAYARDPWFAYGSQDEWSVFSPLYAIILSQFGVENGAMLTTIVGGLLFVAASIMLARAVLRGSMAWLAALMLVAVPMCYSAKDMLFISESFATARMFAVPLSMIAVAMGVRAKLGLALVLHAAAMLLHPSMALAPLTITVLSRLAPRMAALLVLGGCAAAIGLFAAGALGLVSVVDGTWLMFVEPAALVFIGPWIRADLPVVLGPIFLLLIAHQRGNWRIRQLYGITALVAGFAVLLSLVAGDRMPVSILMQAQLWRALWIAQVIGVVALVDLGARFVIRRRATFRLPVLVGTIPLLLLTPPGVAWLAVWLAMKCPWRGLLHGFGRVVRAHRQMAWVFLALLIALNVPGYLLSLSLVATSINSKLPLNDLAIGFLRSGGYGLLPLAIFGLVRRLPCSAAVMVAIPLLVIMAYLWDERSPVQKHWESRYSVDGSRGMFAGQIKRGQTVYWHDSAPRVWLELGTAGYASTRHATGLVFSRERTRILDARLTRVAIRTLSFEQMRAAAAKGVLLKAALSGSVEAIGETRPYVLASYERMAASTPFGIEFLCLDKDLDFVIDPVKADGLQVAEEVEQIDGRRLVNYLYDCGRIRAKRSLGAPLPQVQSAY